MWKKNLSLFGMFKEALVIDSQFPNREILVKIAKEYGADVFFAQHGKKGVSLVNEKHFDILFFDIHEDEHLFDELVRELKRSGSRPYLVAMGDLTSLTKIVKVLKQGADDYLIKPFSSHHIERLISKACLRKKEALPESKTLIAKSPKMQEVLFEAAKIAKSHANVFIQGESGTGKEVFAEFIHQQSYRKSAPFVRVNCAAICENLMESEFFGHEKGSFTGALNTKPGRFELADRGTLLLDEVTEVPLSFQAKLLRVTQELEFEKVGATNSQKVDVRIISTSNRAMQKAMEEKKFREDLFFRLHVIPLYLPALRERKEDIRYLAAHFLEKSCRDNLKPQKIFSSGAIEKMEHYSWPGNIRELRNVCERLAILSPNEEILEEELLFDISTKESEQMSLFKEEAIIPLAEVEERYIMDVLKHFNYNKTKAAEALKINVRTLRNKVSN